MARSRERVIDLSHGMVERLAGTAGVSLEREREYVRNQIVRFLLEGVGSPLCRGGRAPARLPGRPRGIEPTASGRRLVGLSLAKI
jgi:hypothetical protein